MHFWLDYLSLVEFGIVFKPFEIASGKLNKAENEKQFRMTGILFVDALQPDLSLPECIKRLLSKPHEVEIWLSNVCQWEYAMTIT